MKPTIRMKRVERTLKPAARNPRGRAAAVVVVLVTAPDLKTARKLARGALAERLIACANLVPRVESHYVWQGKVEQSAEVLMVMKTTQRRLTELEEFVRANHPYDTAEFLVLPVADGTVKYLAWITASVAG
jgi:periplasmic divalent cation tolerance protein